MKNSITIKINGLLLRITLLLIPVFLITCFYLLLKADYPTYCAVVSEDNVVEYMTSIFYLFASIITMTISISFIKNYNILLGILYFFLAIAFFVFFGEEISWGQRVLGIKQSGFFLKHNLQNETNLHNLDYFKGLAKWFYIITGFYGALFWFLTMPLRKKISLFINSYFIPNWYLMSYFITASVYYIYLSFIMPIRSFEYLTWREQEPAELILSMGFFLFVIINRYRQIQELKLPESKFIAISYETRND